MELQSIWFGVIAFFWVGFLVLEGFDFGVGVLARLLGRDDDERGAYLGTIGPVWDANEVWMIVAVGAMFAAFPGWYASMMSSFYLPLIATLVALIVRGAALEWRGKNDSPGWRRRCDLLLLGGSAAAPLLWGYVLAGMTHGVPLGADGERVAGAGGWLDPYAALGGVAMLALCLLHGAVFLQLRTSGSMREAARRAVARTAAPAAILLVGFTVWTSRLHDGGVVGASLAVLAAIALVAGVFAARRDRDGLAFTGTTVALAATVVGLFVAIHPVAMPSTLGAAYDLTLADAAAGEYGLRILSWMAVFLLPVVLIYQGWAYSVFRRRVSPVRVADARPVQEPSR